MNNTPRLDNGPEESYVIRPTGRLGVCCPSEAIGLGVTPKCRKEDERRERIGIVAAAKSGGTPVRLAAIRALAQLGRADAAMVLAEAATEADALALVIQRIIDSAGFSPRASVPHRPV